ncbi:MAG: R3H domain-containing nucleic acid-binding protein [Bdellovibrionota bacterium]
MTNFFSRLFTKKSEAKATGAEGFIQETLTQLFAAAQLELDFEVRRDQERPEHVQVEVSGADEEMLRAKEGQLLDAIQLFLTRVAQHQLPDERVVISVDSAGYREESNQSLIDLAEKLKDVALEKGKPVYFRALPPRDRKVIHQHLAQDVRVKSRSVGDGLYKKIKIYPIKGERTNVEAADAETV